ncbi:MAG: hypothetical protein CVV44_15285 [Spirochaetae bacterium HGW-Spirochaetae-1]|nr:MAG: hypothetical protein CVV44_15285 [Spirochaetae bacterium HGW-Spirochaetae-1]
MKTYASGTITPKIAAAGNPMYPAYIVMGKEKNLMIDAGINLLGPLYLTSIETLTGGRENLHYLTVTHSHYDHLGALPYLKRMIPTLKTGGHKSIPSLLKKQSVLDRMNRFSELQREFFKGITGDEDVRLDPVELDMLLGEGDILDLGGITCQVLETPGHTRDSLSFYIPELKALFPGEIIGVPDWEKGDEVQVEFLSSYEDYLASLKRLMELDIDFIGMAHGWYFTGDDARSYLGKSLEATISYRMLIEEFLLNAGGDEEKAIAMIAAREYDEKGTIFQERNAYMANLTAQVRHIAAITAN